MATVATSIPELLELLEGTARIEGGRVVVIDEPAFRARTIADLAWTQTFSEDAATVEAARWIIWEASQALGARSASIQDLYTARARGEVKIEVTFRVDTDGILHVRARDAGGMTARVDGIPEQIEEQVARLLAAMGARVTAWDLRPAALDELRDISRNSRGYIAAIEARERARTTRRAASAARCDGRRRAARVFSPTTRRAWCRSSGATAAASTSSSATASWPSSRDRRRR